MESVCSQEASGSKSHHDDKVDPSGNTVSFEDTPQEQKKNVLVQGEPDDSSQQQATDANANEETKDTGARLRSGGNAVAIDVDEYYASAELDVDDFEALFLEPTSAETKDNASSSSTEQPNSTHVQPTSKSVDNENEGGPVDKSLTKEIPLHNKPPSEPQLDTLGVSVYHLEQVFLKEHVCFATNSSTGAPLSRTSKIYEIENLQCPTPGLIRTLSANTACKLDGKQGASYVHSLTGDDHVGEATHMLSYSWGYSIGDIVDTLVHFCETKSLDPKRTYIWICCLCVNQHRVVENAAQQKSGMTAAPPQTDFFSIFGERVKRIGHLLAMMAPWKAPVYLSRVWCIYELFVSHSSGCTVDIVMPPEEHKAFYMDLFHNSENGNPSDLNIVGLYNALANTRVQDAQASVESDRDAILNMVQESTGYTVLNHRVNDLLRDWVRTVVLGFVEQAETQMTNRQREGDDGEIGFAWFHHSVGSFFLQSGDHDSAMTFFQRTSEMIKSSLGTENSLYATVCSSKGNALYEQGKPEEALVEYEKVLTIDGCGDDLIVNTHTNIGGVYEKLGEYDKSLQEHQKALAMKEASLQGLNPPAEMALFHDNIGVVLHKQGKHEEAFEAHRKALDIRQAAFGESHPDTARSHAYIGSILYQKCRYDDALEAYQTASAIRRSLLGSDHPETAQTHKNMGLILAEQGEYSGALQEFRRSLETTIAVLGPDHPETAQCHAAIGSVMLKQKEHDRALVESRKALAISETAHGSHPYTASMYNQVGNVLFEKGELDEAWTMIQKALTIRQSTLGAEHSETAETYNTLGGIRLRQGNEEDAMLYFNKALHIFESTCGPGDPRVAALRNNVGAVLAGRGDYDGALTEFETVLSIQEATLGKDHPSLASLHSNIGNVQKANCNADAALAAYQKCLTIEESALGPKHPDIADTYVSIGSLWEDKGSIDRALYHYRKALSIKESNVMSSEGGAADKDVLRALLVKIAQLLAAKGDAAEASATFARIDPVKTAEVYANMSDMHISQGQYGEALSFLQKAVAFLEDNGEGANPLSIRLHGNIGAVLAQNADSDDAIAAAAITSLQRALALCKSTLGEDSPGALKMHYNIGTMHKKRGDYDAALSEYREVLRIQQSVLGEVHPALVDVYSAIGSVFEEQGNYDEALAQYEMCLQMRQSFGAEREELKHTVCSIGRVHVRRGDLARANELAERFEDVLRD